MVVVVSSCFIHLWGNDNIWKHDSNYMMGLWYIFIYIYNGNIMGIQCYNGNIMVHYMNYGYIMEISYKATYDWEDYTGWEPINMGMDSTLSENIVWRSWPNIRSFSLPSFVAALSHCLAPPLKPWSPVAIRIPQNSMAFKFIFSTETAKKRRFILQLQHVTTHSVDAPFGWSYKL